MPKPFVSAITVATVNVTGDATVTLVVASSEGELSQGIPQKIDKIASTD